MIDLMSYVDLVVCIPLFIYVVYFLYTDVTVNKLTITGMVNLTRKGGHHEDAKWDHLANQRSYLFTVTVEDGVPIYNCCFVNKERLLRNYREKVIKKLWSEISASGIPHSGYFTIVTNDGKNAVHWVDGESMVYELT